MDNCSCHQKRVMMTTSNGIIFQVTGPLCGEFTGPGEFPTERPVTRSFDVFFDLRLNKRLSKQPWDWWFETPSLSFWRQCNGKVMSNALDIDFIHGNIDSQSCKKISYYNHNNTKHNTTVCIFYGIYTLLSSLCTHVHDIFCDWCLMGPPPHDDGLIRVWNGSTFMLQYPQHVVIFTHIQYRPSS